MNLTALLFCSVLLSYSAAASTTLASTASTSNTPSSRSASTKHTSGPTFSRDSASTHYLSIASTASITTSSSSSSSRSLPTGSISSILDSLHLPSIVQPRVLASLPPGTNLSAVASQLPPAELHRVLMQLADGPPKKETNRMPDWRLLGPQTNMTVYVKEMDPCAMPCLVVGAVASPCGVSDKGCLCRDKEYAGYVSRCLINRCTVWPELYLKNATDLVCDAPRRDKHSQFAHAVLAIWITAISLVMARIIFRVTTDLSFSPDDVLVFLIFLFGIPAFWICLFRLPANGIGRDIWTLEPRQITDYLKDIYMVQILYYWEQGLLKLAMIAFYLRVFPTPRVRQLLWVSCGVISCFTVASTLAGAFSCTPAHYFWDLQTLNRQHCIDINALGWANASISVVLDMWLLYIPMSQLRGMNLSLMKKLIIACMFFVGGFFTVIGIIRLGFLPQFARGKNPTWDEWNIIMFSFAEMNVGVICSCMPSIRLLYMHLSSRVRALFAPGSQDDFFDAGSTSWSFFPSLGMLCADLVNRTKSALSSRPSTSNTYTEKRKLAVANTDINILATTAVGNESPHHKASTPLDRPPNTPAPTESGPTSSLSSSTKSLDKPSTDSGSTIIVPSTTSFCQPVPASAAAVSAKKAAAAATNMDSILVETEYAVAVAYGDGFAQDAVEGPGPKDTSSLGIFGYLSPSRERPKQWQGRSWGWRGRGWVARTGEAAPAAAVAAGGGKARPNQRQRQMHPSSSPRQSGYIGCDDGEDDRSVWLV